MHFGDVVELSAGGWLEVLSVSLGAGGAVSVAIKAFFDRHKGTKMTFGTEDRLETAEGYSDKQVRRVLDDIAERQREVDQSWAAMRKQLRGEPDPDAEQNSLS